MAEEPEIETGAVDAQDSQPSTPGARLRAAREARGLSIQDVATRTRIAQRQLEAIEKDDYTALPGIPYAVGFARAYARAVDMDEVAIAAEVRDAVHNSELGANRYEVFEPADPARVPSRALAWTAAAIAIVVIAGFALWRSQLLTPPTTEEIAQQEDAAPAALQRPVNAAPVSSADQPVIFTANDDVWLRIYDEAGERLKDGLMKKGESFTLPANARNPMILTGRPQALDVTVGGKPVPPLGAADRTIADVPVGAEALLSRATPAGQAVSPSAAAPAQRPAAALPSGDGSAAAASRPAAPPAEGAPAN